MVKISVSSKCFCITGETKEARETYQALITAAGGRWVSAVSSAVDYLVAGNTPGPSKMKKAAELNTPIITEQELEQALRAELDLQGDLLSVAWRLPLKKEQTDRKTSKVTGLGGEYKEGWDNPNEMQVKGSRICITGKLDMPRSEYVKLIEAAGGEWCKDISASTDYLVIGEAAGAKVTKAEKAGVPVRTLAALRKALNLEK